MIALNFINGYQKKDIDETYIIIKNSNFRRYDLSYKSKENKDSRKICSDKLVLNKYLKNILIKIKDSEINSLCKYTNTNYNNFIVKTKDDKIYAFSSEENCDELEDFIEKVCKIYKIQRNDRVDNLFCNNKINKINFFEDYQYDSIDEKEDLNSGCEVVLKVRSNISEYDYNFITITIDRLLAKNIDDIKIKRLNSSNGLIYKTIIKLEDSEIVILGFELNQVLDEYLTNISNKKYHKVVLHQMK